MSNEETNNRSSHHQNSIFEAFKNYKEIVMTAASVVAAIFWVLAFFATKDQLNQSKCILQSNIKVLEGKIDTANLTQLLRKNAEDAVELETKEAQLKNTIRRQSNSADVTAALSAIAVKKNQFKDAATEITRKLVLADERTTKALEKLTSGNCVADDKLPASLKVE